MHTNALHTQPARALAVGAQSLEATINGREVYVQETLDVDRFKPVPVQRARRAFGQVKQVAEPQRVNASRIALYSACTAVDPDAALMQTKDRLDVDILELIAGSEYCQIGASAAFFICQAMLAGLSIVGGLVVMSSADDDDAQLLQVLQVLEPVFASLKCVLVEIACTGSMLRLFWLWEKACAAKADALEESGDSNAHQWIQKAALGTARMVANMAYFVCCLESTENNVWALFVSEDGLVNPRERWSPDTTRNMLAAQAALGLLGLLFAGSDLVDLITPRFTSGPLPFDLVDEAASQQ
jgi:hypothetical protein